MMGTWGGALPDGQWDDGGRFPPSDSLRRARADLLERRLREARAFGEASELLSTQTPEFSARGGLTPGQRLTGWLLLICCAVWLFADTRPAASTFAALVAAAFVLIISLRLFTATATLSMKRRKAEPRLTNDALWDLTILVPLYREANVVSDLVASILRLDYPAWRLDVKLLVEADDAETIAAIRALDLPVHFEVIPVPPGEPRTKPKALNYGLAFARGKMVAVFDAEDRPAPEQPRAAMQAFLNGPANLAVVQAPLHIHNAGASWFARQFALEYAIHFRVWLPTLARIGAPLALGGTSNYFRRDVLQRAGGWDAWNVTEDADIGLRLARMGCTARMIEPETQEEAPTRWRQWRNQRTRWMKGHLQTWLVLNRNPIRVMREMGLAKFMITQLTLGGGLLASMLHAPLYLWIAASLVYFHNLEPWHVALFALGAVSAIASAIAARSGLANIPTLLGLLLYWPMQSWAMMRALFEMKLKPHFWAKTPHGMDQPSRTAGALGQTALDGVIQLELPFHRPADAATRLFADRR